MRRSDYDTDLSFTAVGGFSITTTAASASITCPVRWDNVSCTMDVFCSSMGSSSGPGINPLNEGF